MMNEKWIHGEFFVGVSGSILGEISKVICGGISEEFLEWFKKNLNASLTDFLKISLEKLLDIYYGTFLAMFMNDFL